MSLFSKSTPTLLRLPAGSFSVDRSGQIVVGTLPSNFPRELMEEVARRVLVAFREAAAAQLPLATLNIHFASLKITARELRGGAIIYFAPRTPTASAN